MKHLFVILLGLLFAVDSPSAETLRQNTGTAQEKGGRRSAPALRAQNTRDEPRAKAANKADLSSARAQRLQQLRTAIARLTSPSSEEEKTEALYTIKSIVGSGWAQYVTEAKETALDTLVDIAVTDDTAQDAVWLVDRLGGDDTVTLLMKYLRDEDHLVRERASSLIADQEHCSNSLKEEVFLMGHEDSHPEVRRNVIRTLGRKHDSNSVHYLILLMKDDDERVRIAASQRLVHISGATGGWKYKDILIEGFLNALDDSSVEVRSNAIGALGYTNLDDPRSIEPLMALADDANADIRYAVISTLGGFRHPDPRTTEVLIEALNDDNKMTRYTAAVGLGRLHDARVIKPLIEALDDPNDNALGLFDVSDEAHSSLKTLTGQNLPKDKKAWRSWWKKNKRHFKKQR